ncbi:MAG TPA: hypothetical protein VGQ41_21320 [Pyrinomonadaceae bacterium]|jgi:hypothetical protein|nr:hypothetical protein [Pyrinomonadaceae bacterium]
MDLPGFDHLCAQCRRFGLTVDLIPQTGYAPATEATLGSTLDPYLKELLSRWNGGRLWKLYLYGGDGSPNELIGINRDLRLVSDDLPELAELVLFGQIGNQATHLAVVPSVAGADGYQSVVLLDLNEEIVLVPVASNVDRSFELLGSYLDLLDLRTGNIQEGEMDLIFPWDVTDLIARDKDLIELIKQRAFDKYVRGGSDSNNFLNRITGGH